MQLGLGADPQHRLPHGEVDRVAATRVVGVQEVQVVAGDRDALRVVRRAEARDGPFDVGEGGQGLVPGGLHQGRVRPPLSGRGAGGHLCEQPVETYRVEEVATRDETVAQRLRLGTRHGTVDAGLLVRAEERDGGERGLLRGVGRRRGAVRPQVVEPGVESHELAVQFVEGPETEVAVATQLADGEITLVDAVEQRVDGGRLEDLMGAAGVVVNAALRVPVREEGADEPVQRAVPVPVHRAVTTFREHGSLERLQIQDRPKAFVVAVVDRHVDDDAPRCVEGLPKRRGELVGGGHPQSCRAEALGETHRVDRAEVAHRVGRGTVTGSGSEEYDGPLCPPYGGGLVECVRGGGAESRRPERSGGRLGGDVAEDVLREDDSAGRPPLP